MNLSLKTHEKCQSLIDEMMLPSNFMNIVDSIYSPLMELILNGKQQDSIFVSINGAQGTGKSTLCYFLKHLIESESAMHVAAISIDDFYLTRAQRKQLAIDVHPLFQTRGVPGTHDTGLMVNSISSLLEGKTCSIPTFNKAIDDRAEKNNWIEYNTERNRPVEIILFEGWCNNSPYQADDELVTPINELEEQEDTEGIWRTYANEQLKNYHKEVFSQTDMSIMLKAPSFEHIFEWRSLQEEKLKKSTAKNSQSKLMSAKEIKRFIQHYERISRHTLSHLPQAVDVVLPISSDHSIKNIIENTHAR